ncbi:MAG: SH3 domain-containing protein [Treponema sp.]|nr:SH3 domain-containing protein [Treponema sp.]
MKRNHLLLILLSLCCLSGVYAKSPAKRYVSVKDAVLKEKANNAGKKLGSIAYGTEVILLQEEGKWAYVQNSANEAVKGWIPSSSLRNKKITAMNGSVTADAKEIALAGRGWADAIAQVDDAIQPAVYTMVDKIEKNSVSEAAVFIFMKEGELNGGE